MINEFEMLAREGRLKDRYDCYVENWVEEMGELKTFEDWLNS